MMRTRNYGGALLLGGMLALAACAGSNGTAGPSGSNGSDGTDGTNGVNGVTGKMSLTLDSVATSGGVSTLTFTIRPAAVVCPGAVCNDNLSNLGQKTFYAQEYNAANGTFDTARSIQFMTGGRSNPNNVHFRGYTADGNGAQYTVTSKSGQTWSPEASTSAFVYGYVATAGVVPAPSGYSLPSMVASAARVYGTIAWTSKANVAGCERCHGAPYSKHGYRQAKVAGLPDFVSCKVCHTDQRVGADGQWYVAADDPASHDPDVWDTVKYAYTANVMNDTHNSHAFEFNYPQSMANCVTCHAGKLTGILTDANFKPTVCKSCHPVTAVAGVETGRAPSLISIWNGLGTHTHDRFVPGYTGGLDPQNLYTGVTATSCNSVACHGTGGTGPTFAQIHLGYGRNIYADPAGANSGIKLSASRVTTINSIDYDPTAYVATVSFSVSGISTTAATVTWSAYGGVYGWNTKDFLARQSITVTPGADTAKFVGRLNLSSYSGQIASGQVRRVEIALMPTIGIDPTVATTTTGSPYVVGTQNFAAVVTGASQTLDVTPAATSRLISAADAYGKRIVDPAKCNACHDALGSFKFHSPRNGSAGTVGCRICHLVANGAGYFEMQSRSLDSFIHAAHSMQFGDARNADLTNPVEAFRYEEKVAGNYPNFAGALNCESCHYAGTYDPPDQTRSLPGLVSALANVQGRTGLGAFAAEITGPGARACGGCHRAKAINEADGSKLAAFVAHTNDFSSAVMDTTYLVTTAAYLEYAVGVSTTAVAAPAGAQVEQCEICHATSGTQHQTLFNLWKNGL
jgi:OmcA/MtrC family decaheme c-type cytochrome